MKGRTVVNLFLEPSTRTRTAFEISAKKLGAEVVSINTTASSLVKGETLRDTAENIRAMGVDAIVMRHSSAGSARYLGSVLDISVVNAGDGAHEHPTQALLDAFTLRRRFGRVEGLKVTILGDILFQPRRPLQHPLPLQARRAGHPRRPRDARPGRAEGSLPAGPHRP